MKRVETEKIGEEGGRGVGGRKDREVQGVRREKERKEGVEWERRNGETDKAHVNLNFLN